MGTRRSSRDTETGGHGDGATRGHGDTETPGVVVEPVVSEPVEPVAAAAEPLTSPYESNVPWTMGTWSGMPQWRCTMCPFDTLDGEDAMIVHIEARHGPTPTAAPLVQAYDARGNPI